MSSSLPKHKKLVSISQAAKFLRVSIDTVRRWDNSGVLHSERLDGKNRYFSLFELEKHKSSQPLPISDVAKKLSISPTTLRRLEERGLLNPKRNNAGERVYDKDSIEIFLKSDYFLRKKQIKEKILEPHEEKELIEATIPEAQHHERREPAQSPEEMPLDSNLKPLQRIPELLAAVVIFSLLVGIGITNIQGSTIQGLQPKSAVPSELVSYEEPVEASISKVELTADQIMLESIQSLLEEAADSNEATEAAEETAGPDLDDFKIMLTVKTGGAEFINIREKPSTESGKIDEARNGDMFEMVSRDSDWFEIKLTNELIGFISEEFAEIKEIN